MNKQEHQNPERSYGTGDTHPVQSRGGVLAVILAAVVVLGGIISLMGVLNIRLFHRINETQPAVVFSRSGVECATAEPIGDQTPMLGIRCETVSSFLHIYYGLPKGVYVTQVLSGGAAQQAGVSAGDVIVSFAGTPVEDAAQLAELVRSRRIGEAVPLALVRGGKNRPVTVILDGEN